MAWSTRKNIQLRAMAAFENHLKQVPEDARARILVAGYYVELNRVEDAMCESTDASGLCEPMRLRFFTTQRAPLLAHEKTGSN